MACGRHYFDKANNKVLPKEVLIIKSSPNGLPTFITPLSSFIIFMDIKGINKEGYL